jgi:alkaline phosphatase D
MRLVFLSCMTPRLVKPQPVWNHVAALAPDVLLLLGDNVYLDVPDVWIETLQKMDPDPFANHLLTRYREQLAEPGFAAVVRDTAIRKFAIWDDHDFMWNDANGGEFATHPLYSKKMQITTNVMRIFREVLATHDPARWPADTSDPRIWQGVDQPGFQWLGHTAVRLEAGRTVLHLTDGRSFRKKNVLMGDAQRAAMATAFASDPSALHIIASGLPFHAGSGGGWHKALDDHHWLMERAGARGWLMLSGDKHKNDFDVFGTPAGGKLVDATSSGAAIRVIKGAPVITGKELCLYGVADIEPNVVKISFGDGERRSEPRVLPRTAGGSLQV